MDRKIGNYVLHERIGIGGMGEVFRATKQGPDGFEVQVALKVILPHLARERTFRERFSREARLAAQLKHPNIIQINGFDFIEGIPFIEMEYIHGADLRTVLRASGPGVPLPLEESAAVLHGIASGLDHAHRHRAEEGGRGIIHRDLTPHNVMISVLGEVKIADFGIARVAHHDASASATVRGKLAYMSPEQVEGQKADQRSDLFSFGIIAYQLLTGNHPFERSSEAATIAAIAGAEHAPLGDGGDDLPDALCDQVERCLRVDARSRPDSVSGILPVLEAHLGPASSRALGRRVRDIPHAPSPALVNGGGRSATPPTLPGRSRRALPAWPFAAAGALIIAGVILVPLRRGGEAPAPVGPSPFPAAMGRSEAGTAGEPVRAVPVTVDTRPAGAEIYREGISLGRAPVVIRRSQDEEDLLLEARLEGFTTGTFLVPAEAEGRHLHTLTPLPRGTVRVSANPWATVTFMGEEMGETPLVLENVPAGSRTLVLSYGPLGIRRTVEIDVREGLNTVSVDMRKKAEIDDKR